MPTIIGKGTVVVEHDGLRINELAGNVSTCTFYGSDMLSIAHVTVTEPTAEPYLTLQYDEWICLLRGSIEMKYNDRNDNNNDNSVEQTLVVQTGDTCFIKKGERFRPVFPYGDAEYIAVCLPAFSPERCTREEDETTSLVTNRLRELHNNSNKKSHTTSVDEQVVVTPVVVSEVTSFHNTENDIIYHMCEKELWDLAVQNQSAYYPPTFVVDGGFTHATAIPNRLVITANHFYTKSIGDWICLAISIEKLHQLGIVTKYEQPKPVGTTPTPSTSTPTTDDIKNDDTTNWNTWICPHIFGGIPTQIDGIVLQIYSMERHADTGKFLNITGLTDTDV